MTIALPSEVNLEQIERNLVAAVPQFSENSELKDALRFNGATLNRAVQVVMGVLDFSENERNRLSAAKEIFDLHGCYNNANRLDGNITYVIQGEAKIQNILMPTRGM